MQFIENYPNETEEQAIIFWLGGIAMTTGGYPSVEETQEFWNEFDLTALDILELVIKTEKQITQL